MSSDIFLKTSKEFILKNKDNPSKFISNLNYYYNFNLEDNKFEKLKVSIPRRYKSSTNYILYILIYKDNLEPFGYIKKNQNSQDEWVKELTKSKGELLNIFFQENANNTSNPFIEEPVGKYLVEPIIFSTETTILDTSNNNNPSKLQCLELLGISDEELKQLKEGQYIQSKASLISSPEITDQKELIHPLPSSKLDLSLDKQDEINIELPEEDALQQIIDEQSKHTNLTLQDLTKSGFSEKDALELLSEQEKLSNPSDELTIEDLIQAGFSEEEAIQQFIESKQIGPTEVSELTIDQLVEAGIPEKEATQVIIEAQNRKSERQKLSDKEVEDIQGKELQKYKGYTSNLSEQQQIEQALQESVPNSSFLSDRTNIIKNVFEVWLQDTFKTRGITEEKLVKFNKEALEKFNLFFNKKDLLTWYILNPPGNGFCTLYSAFLATKQPPFPSSILVEGFNKDDILNAFIDGIVLYYKYNEPIAYNDLQQKYDNGEITASYFESKKDNPVGNEFIEIKEAVLDRNRKIIKEGVILEIDKPPNRDSEPERFKAWSEILRSGLEELKYLPNTPASLIRYLPYMINKNILALSFDSSSKQPFLSTYYENVNLPSNQVAILFNFKGHTYYLYNEPNKVAIVADKIIQNPSIWRSTKTSYVIGGHKRKTKKYKSYNKPRHKTTKKYKYKIYKTKKYKPYKKSKKTKKN